MRSLDELHRLAEQGHDESQYMLGYMYASGRGAVKDVQKAKHWLEKAAMANNPRAQYYLGELYSEAGKSNPKAAYAQMAYWWGKSASHDYWETTEGYDGRAISMRRLAWLHMHSDFEAANPEDALRLLETLTTRFSSPRSAIELGIVYSAGSFMPLSKRLGGTPIQRDAVKGIRLIERGVLIIENGSNDIDYNLYSAIGDTYLMRESGAPIAAEALHKGIMYKRKALERATGVNEAVASNLRNQLAALEGPPAPGPGPAPRAPEPIAPGPAEAVKEAPRPPLSSELTAKFEKFSEYFDGLELEDKRDFIKNLDQKLQENPNPDYNAFLHQCIEKYKAASHGVNARGYQADYPQIGAVGHASTTGHMPGPGPGAMQDTRPHVSQAQAMHQPQAAFQDTRPDPHGGYHDASTHHHQVPGQYPENDGAAVHEPHPQDVDDRPLGPHPLGKYADHIHGYGAGSTFMLGTVLFTIGSLIFPLILGVYIDHPLGFLGFTAFLFVLPPVIALWLIFVASKNPKPPEKCLTALTLFRLTFFIHLGVIAAIAAGLALRFGMDGQALFGLSIFDSPFDLVIILVSLAVVVLYVTFYYGSLFSILKGIRDNIYSNMFDPISGIGAFSGIHNLISVVVILGSLGVIALGLTPLDLDFVSIPYIITQWFENAYIALALIAFSLITSRIGGLICISVLKQFNSELEDKLEEEYS